MKFKTQPYIPAGLPTAHRQALDTIWKCLQQVGAGDTDHSGYRLTNVGRPINGNDVVTYDVLKEEIARLRFPTGQQASSGVTVLLGAKTWNPGTILPGGIKTEYIQVPGCSYFSDMVLVSHTGLGDIATSSPPANVILSAFPMDTAGNIQVQMFNSDILGAANITVPSGTLRAVVIKTG